MLLAARCPVCGSSVSSACISCWSAVEPAPAHAVVPAAVSFEGAGRRLVLGLKYRNGRTLARPLARRMVPLLAGVEVDLVTWAPTSPARIRRRGFDQAELIARALAAELGVPCRRLLRRVATGSPQTGRSRRERLAATPRFVARRTWRPLRVVLVDDVVTTGVTIRAAEAALRRSGVTEVVCLAGAATP